MALFFLLAALLVIAVLALLLPVFNRKEEVSVAVSRTDTNVAIARAQASDLKLKLDAGEITANEYQDEKARLEAGLARDIEPDAVASAGQPANDNSGQWMFWPLAAVLPIAAGMLYLTLGTPAAIDPANRVAAPEAVAGQQAAPDMQHIVTRIKQQLEQNPEDARGWFMLGRAHLTLGEYEDAAVALRRSVEIDGNNVDVKIRLADAIALTQDGSLLGEPAALLKSALEQRPDHPQGLWLHGMAVNEAGDPEAAIGIWNKLMPLLSADPKSASEVEQLIANAKQQVAGASTNNSTTTDAGTNAGSLVIEVDVKQGLADDLPADTAVFVYAKAVSGPPMPLAVVKHTLGELPLTVTLSDAQAMIDSMKLSAFTEVAVGARISRTGDPIAQSGDLFTEISNVDTSRQQRPLKITISETLP